MRTARVLVCNDGLQCLMERSENTEANGNWEKQVPIPTGRR